MIDVDKFVASLIKHYCETYGIDITSIRCWFDDALEEQGLEYKDGEIVKTQRRVAAEAKEAIFDDEDERIRESLVEIFKLVKEKKKPVVNEENANLILAWLEKQGEQKPVEEANGDDYGIDSLWHAQTILEKTLGTVDGYETDDGILEHKCAISAVKKLRKQKPAWSEEDEIGWTNTMIMIKEVASNHYTKDSVKLVIDWLKSLKDRLKGGK